MSRPCDTR